MYGSFENEALENEDRSTKHPNLENDYPYLLWNLICINFENKNNFPTLVYWFLLAKKKTQAKCFVMIQSTNEF